MALVEASAGQACASCSSRGSCSLVAGERKRRLWMMNGAGARPGDSVEFSISPRAVVGMSLLLYALPAVSASIPRRGAFGISYAIIKLSSACMAGRKSSRPVMIRVSGKDTEE